MAQDVKEAQPDQVPNVESVSDLVEITRWLGTYRERLRLASTDNQPELANHMRRWKDRLLQRRAEPA